MLNTRTVSILLAAAVAVTGVFLYLQAEEGLGVQIVLIVEQEEVSPPGEIKGAAMTLPEGDVEVTATVDGEEIDGSPDIIMEGALNEFSFPVNEEMSGRTVTITATDANGKTTVRHVRVN